MRRQGVIELEPGRVEIAVLAEDVVGRVGGEYERRIVGETRCVVQTPVAEERAREQSAERPLPDALSANRWRQPRFTNPFTSC